MPRSGKGTRNRRTMAEHAQTRLLNAELRETARSFTPDAVAQRVSERVYRVTGERIPSGAVFTAMGIRQVNPVAGRGAWLTAQAMDESASTDRRTDAERQADAHAKRDRRVARAANGPTVGAMRKTVARIESDAQSMFRALAQWSAWDEIYFARVHSDIAERFDATGDNRALSEDLRKLALMRESSRLWENSTLMDIRAGQMTVERLRALITAKRRNDVVNGRKPPKVSDFPFWDATAPVVPKVEKAVRPRVLASAEPVADHAQEIMLDNKYFTRGTD